MTRTRVRHVCTECGTPAPRWVGRCPECGTWGTVVEEAPLPSEATPRVRRVGVLPADVPRPQPIGDVDPLGAARRPTGIDELDRVLGGGLVAGSVTLLGGEPGIGKSTLVVQALAALARRGATVLLVTAEESAEQVRVRAERLDALEAGLLVLAETSLPRVLAHMDELTPDVVVVDSIQAVLDPDLPGSPGAMTQVRECASALVRAAKSSGTAVVLVGHVTKDGGLAGPRALEHVVDTVLSFEGDRHHALRMLRALKHRFGATSELGLFEMSGDGLVGVPDASALFLADRHPGAPGSMVAPVLEGARPLLVEIQALVAPTTAPVPRRSAQGLDSGRLALVVAVLEQRAGVAVGQADVFASVAGGVRVGEAGADLALALALAGAKHDAGIDGDTVALGEIGLGGEVRQVSRTPYRLAEAARLGFRRAIVPSSTPDVAGLELVRVGTLAEALQLTSLARSARGARHPG